MRAGFVSVTFKPVAPRLTAAHAPEPITRERPPIMSRTLGWTDSQPVAVLDKRHAHARDLRDSSQRGDDLLDRHVSPVPPNRLM